MPVDDMTQINIRHFLTTQQSERYHAFVIHGPPLSGKTEFARKLVSTTFGGVYIDILRHVNEQPALAQTIDLLDAPRLGELVVTHAQETDARLLLVDEIDFLVHMWSDDLAAFKYMLSSLSVNQTPIVIGFLLQTQHALEEWSLPNSIHQNRILQLKNIQPL